MIRTVVVEDSRAFRAGLIAMLHETKAFEVVGVAEEGEQGVQLVARVRPDLVIMDVLMAGLDGVAATAKIMELFPCPVVVLSSLVSGREQQIAFQAMAAGAIEVMSKPRDVKDPKVRSELTRLLATMATVKVIRHRAPPAAMPAFGGAGLKLVLIGASTGGPPAVLEVLRPLPASFPGAVVLAQHLTAGFAEGMRGWMRDTLQLKVHLVPGRTALEPGTLYLAPDGHHLEISRGDVMALPARGDPLAPSVDRLFESAAPHPRGVLGIVLTGMGTDGARGLSELRRRGCHTIAQDEASSLIWGMPQAAVQAGAAVETLAPQQIGARLLGLSGTASHLGAR